MKKTKKKYMALAAVALILSLLTAVSVTYSWIDDVKQVEFDNDNVAKNGAPLKSGVDINSDIVITKGENSINLGNILQNSDLMIDNYNYGTPENPDLRAHTKYEDAQSPSWSDVNKKKGYFYESGDMHLSGCYSDGETFYFPRQGTNVSGYREGNRDDENVNYISFTARVSSPDANVDFWFKELPTIKDNKTKNDIAKARFAITVDGDHHVYSPDGYANTVDGGNPSPVSGVRKTSVYTYGNRENTTTSRGANSNTLFSVKKGGTVNLNIKIWLETGFDANITASDINLQLISSWAYERIITIEDKTTSKTYSSWIGKDSATMFLTLPSVLEDIDKVVNKSVNVNRWSTLINESGYSYAPFYPLSKRENSYSVTVPLVFNNEEMVIYRCTDRGWNSSQHTSGEDPVKRGPDNYKVTCWNWWETKLPNTYRNETYTLYGSSYDDTATNRFGGTQTNKGYGTWGGVVEVTFDGYTNSLGENNKYGGTNHPNLASSDGNTFVRDYSDYSTSGDIYTYIMISSGNVWKTYIPVSSTLIQFHYYLNDNTKGWWGYYSWTGTNPQVRPSDSVIYYATQNVEHDDGIHYQGVGFWEGADSVFLIANGSMKDYTPYDNIYYSSVSSSVSAGRTDMNETALTYNDGTNTSKVFQTKKTGDSTPAHYYRVKFDDGTQSSGHETNEKILFPGCYFDWKNDRWLGSLTSSDRGTVNDINGGTGEDSTGDGSIDGYTIDSGVTFKVNENEIYTAYQKNDNTNSYKVRINFVSTSTKYLTVLKDSHNYGLGNNSSTYIIPNNNPDIYLNKDHNFNFGLTPNSAGHYIVTFEYDNGNDGTIKITNVSKESSN